MLLALRFGRNGGLWRRGSRMETLLFLFGLVIFWLALAVIAAVVAALGGRFRKV